MFLLDILSLIVRFVVLFWIITLTISVSFGLGIMEYTMFETFIAAFDKIIDFIF